MSKASRYPYTVRFTVTFGAGHVLEGITCQDKVSHVSREQAESWIDAVVGRDLGRKRYSEFRIERTQN